VARLRPTIASRPIDGPGNEPAPPLGRRVDSLEDRVAMVIDLIRPAVQADGGDVELVDITPEKVVRIRLHGACIGCPSSSVTLQVGIERNLREHVPEISGVQAVD
jgi:Fe-S cluster biogenesis protein NfuA